MDNKKNEKNSSTLFSGAPIFVLSAFLLVAAQTTALKLLISSDEYVPSGIDYVTPAIEESLDRILEVEP
tara:strand:+ start:2910 stop:3116 length:207 start_codon:yes stop_codon:yes gene_type:complete